MSSRGGVAEPGIVGASVHGAQRPGSVAPANHSRVAGVLGAGTGKATGTNAGRAEGGNEGAAKAAREEATIMDSIAMALLMWTNPPDHAVSDRLTIEERDARPVCPVIATGAAETALSPLGKRPETECRPARSSGTAKLRAEGCAV